MPRRRDDEPDLRPIINEAEDAFLRLPPRTQLILAVVVIVVGLIAAVVYFGWQHRQQGQTRQNPPVVVPPGPAPTPAPPTPAPYPPTPPGTPALSADMLLGNPSGATADPSNRDNYLMVKPYFSLSYNNSNGTPNWVSWRVTAADLGTAPRKPVFDPDLTLPQGFKVVQHRDYTGSGFDRGHMCPHSDRAGSKEMSFATFVLTNIVPQAPSLNRKAWAQEEEYLRTVVRRGNRLYVVAGPVGRGGTGDNGPADSIAGGRVAVPAATWKVAVVVPVSGGDEDLAKINTSTRVLSVIMPNDNGAVGEAWAQYRTSTAEVERQTGLHFFDRLPPDVAGTLKQKVDTEPLPAPRPMSHGND